MNPHALYEETIRRVVARTPCAVCGRHFSASDARIIGRRGNVWAVRVACRACRARALLLAAAQPVAAPPVYSDLTPDEWERFKDRPPISVDDVIAFHRHISAYAGDFSEILEEPLPDE